MHLLHLETGVQIGSKSQCGRAQHPTASPSAAVHLEQYSCSEERSGKDYYKSAKGRIRPCWDKMFVASWEAQRLLRFGGSCHTKPLTQVIWVVFIPFKVKGKPVIKKWLWGRAIHLGTKSIEPWEWLYAANNNWRLPVGWKLVNWFSLSSQTHPGGVPVPPCWSGNTAMFYLSSERSTSPWKWWGSGGEGWQDNSLSSLTDATL